MAGPGVIQAELSIELGRIAGQLNQAQALIANFAAGAGSAMKPANQAVDNLAKSVQKYKAEQTQQARTVSYFVRELTDITGMSREAASAVGGLGQIILEAAAGGSAFAIGFEAVKFVLTQVVAIFKEAEERAKGFAAAQLAATEAIMAGRDALARQVKGPSSPGEQASSAIWDAAAAGIKKFGEESEKLRPTTWAFIKAFIWDGAEGIKRISAETEKLAGQMTRVISETSNRADIARALTQEGQKAAQAGMANKVLADDWAKARERSLRAVKAEAIEQKRIADLIASTMSRMGDAASADRGNFPDMFYNDATAKEMKMNGPDDPFAPVYGPGNTEGAKKFIDDVKTLNNEASRTTEIFSAIGDSIGSAFGSIGQMVGGAAQVVLKVLGQMIQQAVQLAISLAMASMAWTSPLGMIAIGSIALAGILGLIAAVPSFDVGTLSVPRTGLAMVHQGEAILPADGTAQAYRSGGRSVTNNFAIYAVDGASVYRTLTDNRGPVARALREMARDS